VTRKQHDCDFNILASLRVAETLDVLKAQTASVNVFSPVNTAHSFPYEA
jgi:hypothetical protein